MATRNLSPRATGEGSIGTSIKKWLAGWFGTVNATTVEATTVNATTVNTGTVATTGKVGIETSAPLMKLQVGTLGGLDTLYAGEIVWKNNAYYSTGLDRWLTGANKASQIVQDGSGISFWVSNDVSTGAGNAVTDWNAKMRLQANGALGIGTTSPTAIVHIKAGTAAANTAPLKFTVGTNLTTPESGAVEFDGTNLYITIGGIRKTVQVA